MNKVDNTHGFDMVVNVDMQVIETDTNTIKQHVVRHNKATRNMIKGILRFLEGRFTPTYANSIPEYEEDAKNYVPCYVSFGDGGVLYDDYGVPEEESVSSTSSHVPKLDSGWTTKVDYNSTELVREFQNLSHQRSRIRKQEDTLSMDPAGDMDTVVLYSETPPGDINFDIVDGQGAPGPRFITEVGLFSNHEKTQGDLLAYVKLSNYKDDPTDPNEEWKTNTLYVRPGDTVIITWYITVVALSDISVVDSSEELVEPLIGEIAIGEDPNT